MKNLENAIKDNAKFLQAKVNSRFDSILNPEMDLWEVHLAQDCIFCAMHPVNNLIFDIVSKFYAISTGAEAVRLEHNRRCDHLRWHESSTAKLAYFILYCFEYGFADIWAVCGNVEKIPIFGPRNIIATLADFDLMEFILDRCVERLSRGEKHLFGTFQDMYISKSSFIDASSETQRDLDFEELDNILKQNDMWRRENKQISIPQEVQNEIFVKHGKNLLEKYEQDEVEQLVRQWQEYADVYARKNLTISLLETIGKEWLKLLRPSEYNLIGFPDIENRLEYNQSLMTYNHDPKSRWAYEKEELLAWKVDVEKGFGRKIVFPT